MGGKIKLEGRIAEKAVKLLEDICKILDSNNIKYNLEGGTLLGIVRENRLLPWDTDMDITVTEKEIPALLKIRWDIWKKGYRSKLRYYGNDFPPFKKGQIRMMKISTRKWFFFKGITLLDIFIKSEQKEKYFWTVGTKKQVLKSVEKKFYDNLTKYEFNKYYYSVPEQVDEYLTCRYGDWKIPKKEWNCSKDDHAIVKKGD